MESVKALPYEDADSEKPSASVIRALKDQFPGRDLHRVEKKIGDDGEPLVFVMTGPTRAEWKKYQADVALAGEDEAKIEKALLHGVLPQIKWPDRPIVEAIFEKYPALIATFPRHLNAFAGLEAETTVKKL